MDITIVILSIIAGIFGLLSIIALHISYKYKLRMTMEAEQIKAEREMGLKRYDVKIAKIKSPIAPKRMPRGYTNQIMELVDVLGRVDPEVLDTIVDTLAPRQDDLSSNKIIKHFLPMAQQFLQGMQDGQQQQQQSNLLYEP